MNFVLHHGQKSAFSREATVKTEKRGVGLGIPGRFRPIPCGTQRAGSSLSPLPSGEVISEFWLNQATSRFTQNCHRNHPSANLKSSSRGDPGTYGRPPHGWAEL